MRVCDLQAVLAEMPEGAEVRIASQPQWPFEYSLGQVGHADVKPFPSDEELEAMSEEEQERFEEACDRGEYAERAMSPWDPDWPEDGVVYIGEGTQLGYLPACGSRAVGWRE